MSAHLRGQLARAIRLALLFIITVASTTPVHDLEVRFPIIGAGVTFLEVVWRQISPTVPLNRVESFKDHRIPPLW